jgi:hypothetical protein
LAEDEAAKTGVAVLIMPAAATAIATPIAFFEFNILFLLDFSGVKI